MASSIENTGLEETLRRFAAAEGTKDPLTAKWYIVAAAALASASAGSDVPRLYQIATEGLELEERKQVQRRLKEAILKTSCLYGVPRSLQALLPLFATLPDEEIDHYGPRWDSLQSPEAAAKREQRGRQYFDKIWTPVAAQANRDRNFKFQPDLFLLNLQMIYEWYISEDAILDNVETQMCNNAALICSNCPVQAMWHARGVVRHGGSKTQAAFAQELGLAVAKLYECKVGNVVDVDKIDFEDETPH